MTSRFDRRAAALLILVAAFVALIAVSAAFYPGGNALDRAAPGHDLLRNFLCDLLQPVAENGRPNPVGRVATPLALVALAAALALHWSRVPALFPRSPALGRVVTASGLTSLAGVIAVGLTPSERSGGWHAVAIFTAAIPALMACLGATWGLARARRPALAAACFAALALGTVDGVLYAGKLAGGSVPLALPLLQNLSTAIFVGWVVACALARR